MMNQAILHRFMAKVEIPTNPDGCWLWKANKRNGYGLFMVNGKMWSAHRFAWRLFVGWFKKSLKVLHRCDTPSCVNPRHLFLGTQKDNAADMLSKNRQARGERQHLAILTESNVLDIRRLNSSGVSMRELSEKFDVSVQTIWRMLRGQTWKHIT